MGLRMSMITNGGIVRDRLGRFASRFPKVAQEDLRMITKIYCTEWRAMLREYKLGWTGRLWRALKPKKQGEGYIIEVPRYGINLEYRKGNRQGYFVGPDTRGRVPLAKWIEQRLGYDPGFIYVKSYPWISSGVKRARIKIKGKLENGKISKLIKGKGG